MTGNRFRKCTAGLAATLLMTVSASALHAETSNNELAREIAELKAQIRSMKGAISQTRAESREAVRVARTPERGGYVLPPPSAPPFALPPGATPVFVTADKKMQYGAHHHARRLHRDGIGQPHPLRAGRHLERLR